ncbi:MAG TPA: hypothetical protein VMV92_12965, partial [Streptosporangiaceae bacterium]|nr:hypothetical protein [Streptosporangiaceae bacterium]
MCWLALLLIRITLAATSRRSSAEALTTVTVALAPRKRGAPEPEVLRRALFAWAFNPGTRTLDPPADITAALDWAAAASQPVTALEDPATLRAVLGACARTCAGKPRRSPRPSTAASSPAPPRPRRCSPRSGHKARAVSTWKRSSAASTT